MDEPPLRLADRPGVEVEDVLAAPPAAVWPEVIGLDAMVAASSELQACTWLTDPGPGGRFTGTNRREDMGEWTTTCLVTTFDVGAAFGWDVYDGPHVIDAGGEPISSWRFTLTADGAGTRLAQRVQLGVGRSGLSRAIASMPDRESAVIAYRLGDFERNMRANLAEIKRRVER